MQRIIVVDDNITNLTACRGILNPFYEVYTASSAAKLFVLMEEFLPDLILLDVEMPEMNGYEVARILSNEQNGFKKVPFIFVSAHRDVESELKGFSLGALDYIYKPFAAEILLRRIETHLSLIGHRKELRELNASMQKMIIMKAGQVWKLQNAVLNIISDLVEYRDQSTGGHVVRTQGYLCCMIEKLIEEDLYADEITKWNLDFAIPSAQLHDLGKIGISDAILNKPDKLTPEEYEIIKTHVKTGVDAIIRMEKLTQDSDFFRHAKIFAGTHHERWDGLGYPNGLKGLEIPLEGRLMAIADVYDALISKRSYKPALTPSEVAGIIKEGRGTQFDPQLVDVFGTVSDRFANIVNEPCALI